MPILKIRTRVLDKKSALLIGPVSTWATLLGIRESTFINTDRVANL